MMDSTGTKLSKDDLKAQKKMAKKNRVKNPNEKYYHFMLLPGMVLVFIFSIVPMFGIVMAFQDYKPALGITGSPWVGLTHFKYMFELPDSYQIFFNTIYIAVGKIILGMVVPIIFALILNEAKIKWFKNAVQTIVYLPNFISWVVLGTVVSIMFSYGGMINNFLESIGLDRILFLGSNTWFRPLLIATDVWKGYGYGTIIYLAALTAIDPALYESAAMDGASRFKQMIHITLPALLPTIVLLATLNLGSVLSAGFDQVFNLYNPVVYKTGDIIDTFVYRMGLVDMQFSFATAVGLLKSTVSFVLILISYKLADKYAGYRII